VTLQRIAMVDSHQRVLVCVTWGIGLSASVVSRRQSSLGDTPLVRGGRRRLSSCGSPWRLQRDRTSVRDVSFISMTYISSSSLHFFRWPSNPIIFQEKRPPEEDSASSLLGIHCKFAFFSLVSSFFGFCGLTFLPVTTLPVLSPVEILHFGSGKIWF